MNPPIYLDYNGTTPIAPEVIAAMMPFLEHEFGNPSSSHWYGIRPRQAVENARRQVAAALNCQPGEIVFTSGGTESNNHAIMGMLAPTDGPAGGHIITSSVEHPAVLEVCRHAARYGVETTYLPVDGYGRVDPDDVAAAVRSDTRLITIMHANNEVGTIQPIAEIAAVARQHGILLHTDAAQSLGKIPCQVSTLGVGLLSVAGHKLYAPKGIGALYVKADLKPAKFCQGAGQERGARAGTENVLGIVGLGKACEIAQQDLQANMDHMRLLKDRLHERLSRDIPELRLNGHPEQCLPNTLSLSFKGLQANRILEEIGLAVAISAGAACHSDTVEISHVLSAMGVPGEWAMGTLRFSVGRMTTATEIDRVADVVAAAVAKLRQS